MEKATGVCRGASALRAREERGGRRETAEGVMAQNGWGSPGYPVADC